MQTRLVALRGPNWRLARRIQQPASSDRHTNVFRRDFHCHGRLGSNIGWQTVTGYTTHVGGYCSHTRQVGFRASASRLPRSHVPSRASSTLSHPVSSLQGCGQTLTLPSGRQLGYHTSGPATGIPIIYIHGHPDSGITITGPLETRVASDLNIRWIGPDRPGVGLSTPYDAQTVVDYPADIRALAEYLQLPEYYLLGTSGGTGFTLACAKQLPRSQLKGVGICAGVGPLECGFDSMDELQRTALEGWRDYPAEFRGHYEKQYVPLAQDEDTAALTSRIRGELEAAFTGRDREAVLQESAVEMAVKSLKQAWMQGAWAHAKGMELHWQPWGFRLEDVAFPGIKLWYGEKDVSTTPTMGKYMAERLEGSQYREYAGESHYTIWGEGNLQQMVRDLLGR